MHLDAATILLQWATGGLAFLWVTTRGRLVSLGYGWLLRGVYGVLALGAAFAELRSGHTGDRPRGVRRAVGRGRARGRARARCS